MVYCVLYNCFFREEYILKDKKTNKPRKRGIGLRILKPLMLGRYKRPDFVFIGGQPMSDDGAIILSNHAGTDGPLSLEFYLDRDVAFWGASEMTSGLIPLYSYQSRVYYHEKKHWNLFLSHIFCLLASPLTNIFYSGLDMIPTYHDARFVKTLRDSIRRLSNKENIVIFPEDSSKGYLDQLEGFHGGFASLLQMCDRRGVDVPVYVSYFRKSDMKYIFDKPIMLSELVGSGESKEQIARRLCERCNALGRMSEQELSAARQPAETADGEQAQQVV